jgi:acyl-CoA synthetase (AMP-forming)/AMP-acid ligase II
VIGNVVLEAGRRFRDQVALVSPDGIELTYLDLYRLTESVAAGLKDRDIEAGDVVSLVMRSSLDYVVAYLAAARIGAITAGVNPRLGSHERRQIIERSEPQLVIAADDLAEGIPSDMTAEVVSLSEGIDDILPSLRGEVQAPRLSQRPEHPVAIVFTSGTTGEPKGAVFRNKQLAAITMFDNGGKWGGGGPMLSATELCHVGFMTKLPWYLRAGSTIHMLRKWRAQDALDRIEQHRMSSIGGIPAQIALILRRPDLDQRDLSSVKAIIVGGGHSSPALIEEARRRLQAAYSVRYSSTESGGVGTLTAFDAPEEEALHTVGRPRDGIDLVIRSEDGQAVKPGEVGEVTLRSPAMMSEYWRDPEATAATLRDSDPEATTTTLREDPGGKGKWLHTGDLGYIDESGCLRLQGRAKEMYIRGGYNVYPMEVEAVISTHPDVAEVAVVPRADDVMGEIGVAVVVPASGSTPPTLEDLRSFAGANLAAYKLPEDLRITDELPLTGMHKVDRRKLAGEISSGPESKDV